MFPAYYHFIEQQQKDTILLFPKSQIRMWFLMRELPECLCRISEKNSGHVFSGCMPYITEYLLQKFSFSCTEKPSSQQSGGKKRQRGKCQDSLQKLVGEKKTGKNKQSNRKDGRPTKMTSKWQLGSRDSDEQSLKTDGLSCQRKSWSGRTAHMPLIREDDWGFFKSEQSWKWVGSKDGSRRQHSN